MQFDEVVLKHRRKRKRRLCRNYFIRNRLQRDRIFRSQVQHKRTGLVQLAISREIIFFC